MAIVPRSLSPATVASMLLLTCTYTNAFNTLTPQAAHTNIHQSSFASTTNVPFLHASHLSTRRKTASIIMSMSDESGGVGGEEAAAEYQEDEAYEGEVVEDQTEEEVEEVEIPQEDPQITAIKEEIAGLESSLKMKRQELSRSQDLVDEYSERGYQRKCAEMDNMRRMRAAASSTNLQAAKANVIQKFLPNLYHLRAIVEAFNEDEFAQSYRALQSDFENNLKSLDLAEFTVDIGSKYDTRRCKVIAEEDCEIEEAGVVLSVEREGYEVLGNIIQLAEVVVSKGQELEPEPESESVEGAEEEITNEE